MVSRRQIIMPQSLYRVWALSDDARLTSVCLSVCLSVWLTSVCLSCTSGYKSRTERPKKTKIGTWCTVRRRTYVAHFTRDWGTCKVTRSTCRGLEQLWRPPAKLVSLAWFSVQILSFVRNFLFCNILMLKLRYGRMVVWPFHSWYACICDAN